jgi:signal transduction histidine kinase
VGKDTALSDRQQWANRLWPQSIRWQFQVWLAFLLICLLTGFGFAMFQIQRADHSRQIDVELERRIAALSRTLRDASFTRALPATDSAIPHPPPNGANGVPRRPPPGPPPGPRPSGMARKVRPAPEPPKPTSFNLPPDVASFFGEGSYYFVVWYRDGALLNHSPDSPPELRPPNRADRDTLTHWRTRANYREAFHCSGLADCALVGTSMVGESRSLRAFASTLFAVGGAILALGLGVGWWITTKAIGPIEQISSAAVKISQGNLAERISGDRRNNEFGRLVSVLNSTFARLEAAFERQRKFTADAAHELRTPLAVIISETQKALSRQRSPEDYRRSLETCHEVAQEMRKLSESLLELSRLDERVPAVRDKLDLAKATEMSINKYTPLAAAKGLRIGTDLRPVAAYGDPARVEQVIANLLMNAIQYNKEHGEIRLRTQQEGEFAVLCVEDTGIGIAETDLSHVFDRFYRADLARHRAEGHAGLGLAICKAIVDSGGGSIRIQSVIACGTTVTVRFPAVDLSGRSRSQTR